MRQDKEPFGMVMKAECAELSAWEKEIRREGVRNKDEIRSQGTLARERLVRA